MLDTATTTDILRTSWYVRVLRSVAGRRMRQCLVACKGSTHQWTLGDQELGQTPHVRPAVYAAIGRVVDVRFRCTSPPLVNVSCATKHRCVLQAVNGPGSSHRPFGVLVGIGGGDDAD